MYLNAAAHYRPSASILCSLLLALFLVPPVDAKAQDAIANFYKGKQLKVIVGSEAGNGYDLYARLMTRHLGRFIPGNPSFIVQNQLGSAGIAAANAVFVTQPQDGTVIGGLQPGTPVEQILGHDGPQFVATQFNWMGNLNKESSISITMAPAKARTFDDLRTVGTIYGTSGPNTTEQYPAMLVNMLGAKIKLVSGYPSIVDVGLAMQRGEVEGFTQGWVSFRKRYVDLLKDNKINLLVQYGAEKEPDLPNVPLVTDLLTEKYLLPEFKPTEAEAIWRIMLLPTTMSRPFVLGPKVPADRVAALRKAFTEMTKDPQFLADAASAKLDINPTSGEDLQQLVAKASQTPKPLLDKVAVVSKPKEPK
jgi:tripartite-type tricarboxylate transporter receptor subunit TctC